MQVEMGKKYKTRSGYPVTVLSTSRRHYDTGSDVVVTLVHKERHDDVVIYDLSGKFYRCEEHPLDLFEISFWDDFKEGEPVMVRDYDDETWCPRYFAGINKSGRPLVYTEGTKWSSRGDTIWYAQCRRPTPEELNNC